MSNEAPPAGWYPNPDGTGGLRWWSGVGWTDITREAGTSATPTTALERPAEPTQVLAEPAPEAVQADQSDQSQWANPWGQPVAPVPVAPIAGYNPYAPIPVQPLTASGMRPLSGMFSDIGRIVRRAWLPIVGISFTIWAVVSAVIAAVTASSIDLDALRRGLTGFANEVQTNPDGSIESAAGERILSDFQAAFSGLSPGAWAVLGTALFLLTMAASLVQVGAVSRLSMDAAAGQPVTWGAGWRSGFVAGLRLFGYWALIGIVALVVFAVVVAAIAVLAQLSPALAGVAGVAAFFAAIVLAFLFVGRLVPLSAQAVVGRHALRWSWQHTRGKFWAVVGRYLLWSMAASIVIQVISTIVAIPVSLLFLGQLSSASTVDQMGASLELQLLMLPFTMALGAITVLGIAPIWRDLSDDPVYRSIDEDGQPIEVSA